MRVWRSRIMLLAVIVLLPLEIVLIAAMWPYLGLIGKALAGLIITCCVCGSVYILALAYHQIALMAIRRQREYFSRRFIVAGTIVAFHQEDGLVRNLSAEQPQLPAPMVLEEEEGPKIPPDHWRILELAGKGMDLRSVALACNTTYYQVQKITSQWKDKMKQAGYVVD